MSINILDYAVKISEELGEMFYNGYEEEAMLEYKEFKDCVKDKIMENFASYFSNIKEDMDDIYNNCLDSFMKEISDKVYDILLYNDMIEYMDSLMNSDVKDVVNKHLEPLNSFVNSYKKLYSVLHDDKNRCVVCQKETLNSCFICKNTFYCSYKCQEEHWNYHKKVCKLTDFTQTIKIADQNFKDELEKLNLSQEQIESVIKKNKVLYMSIINNLHRNK